MNRCSAHERPSRPMQRYIPYRKAVQEQSNPRWDSVPISRRCQSTGRLESRRYSSRSLELGLGDSTVDPGEVLLRLVTQSAARAGMHAQLLEEAYEAAERLKRSEGLLILKQRNVNDARTSPRSSRQGTGQQCQPMRPTPCVRPWRPNQRAFPDKMAVTASAATI